MRNLIEGNLLQYKDEILDFTGKLISIPTENPPGRAYEECIGMLGKKLGDIGLDFEVIEIPHEGNKVHPRFCLLSSFGEGQKTLYFHGHYDVVPSSHKEDFHPRLEAGKLFGRGASDMKGGLTSMIYAIRVLKETGIVLNGRITLVFVPDEETGGFLGTQHLMRSGAIRENAIGMLTAEPTGGMVWNSSRGAISLRITVKGKPAHVGLHYSGINAFEKMLPVVNALLELKKKIKTHRTSFHIEPDEARSSILLIGGLCKGGTHFNVVPSECSFTVDRRLNPEEKFEEEKQALFGIFDRMRMDGIDLDVEVLQEGTSAGVPEINPLGKALARSVKAVIGRAPSFEMCPGLLETRFYAALGIPAFAYGPGLLSVSHGPEEFVFQEDIYNCSVIYALTAAEIMGKSQHEQVQ